MHFAQGQSSARRASFPAKILAALSIGLLLGGCGAIPHYTESSAQPEEVDVTALSGQQAQPAQLAQGAQPAGAPATDGAASVEKVPFRVGVSSATVERLAKLRACTGGPGAGLITQPGPVEVYRMQCDSGRVFMARCELRQCKAM